jgi:hypothetical protein
VKSELKSNANGTRRQVLVLCGVLLAAAIGYTSWFAWRAHRNLVTLDVRNMEVRQVVKKISWQTWEDIFVHKDVQGNVTLRVSKMPLEQVLRLVGEQTFSRPSSLYPLYSKGESFTRLKKTLRGEIDPALSGWTNLQARGFGGGPPMLGFNAGFNMPGQPQNQLLSLNIVAKDLAFATLAFNRFAQARVVPEDGASATVTLSLNKSTVPAAVARLAKAAHFKWTTVYALQGGRGPGAFAGAGGFGGPREGGPREFGGARDGRDTNGPGRRGFGGPEMNEEMRQQRELLEAELRQALPAEERQKMEQAQQEREAQMQAMANMTPEERMQQFAQRGGGPGMDKMNRDRIMNSTPEQRAARRGPGGPGGPGGVRGPR